MTNFISLFGRFGLVLLFVAGLSVSGCNNKNGCTDATAANFDAEAEEDDGSCTYQATLVFRVLLEAGCGNVQIILNGSLNTTIPATTSISDVEVSNTSISVAAGTFNYEVRDDCDTWTGEVVLEAGDLEEINLSR